MGLGLASAGIRRLEMGKGRGIGDLRDGRSSPRGSGWAPTGMVTPPLPPGSTELPRATRRTPKRRTHRSWPLPRGHFNHAAPPGFAMQMLVSSLSPAAASASSTRASRSVTRPRRPFSWLMRVKLPSASIVRSVNSSCEYVASKPSCCSTPTICAMLAASRTVSLCAPFIIASGASECGSGICRRMGQRMRRRGAASVHGSKFGGGRRAVNSAETFLCR